MTRKHREIILPPSVTGVNPEIPETPGRIIIIGANGAGKSRFMEEMISLCDNRAYALSAISAPFPEREESTLEGSIDSLYRKAVENRPYMRADAVSELDKLSYMLVADEFENLIAFKQKVGKEKKKIALPLSRLDRLKKLWEEVFPGSKIIYDSGTLMFSTTAGKDLIELHRLSQGEKSVLYYAAAVLYAAQQAVIFIDSPSLFLHPAVISSCWTAIEQLRPDCTFVYNSVDIDFIRSRQDSVCIWVKNFDSSLQAWDYDLLPESSLTEDLFVELTGSRRPILFIEGDSRHSIDARLYSLVFNGWTIRPLGSCNKVIETTRTFNDLKYLHHLRSRGIVDRDRRTPAEVEYLRNKDILVPEVAEVENIFMIENIIRIMARHRGKDPDRIFKRIKREVLRMFRQHIDAQALQHVRHKVKREVECRIDAKFTCITALETHLRTLVNQLQPRKFYNLLRQDFHKMLVDEDYNAILRVFNHKPMLPNSGLHQLLGYRSKDDYIVGVLELLKETSKDADAIRNSIRHCFLIDNETL